ncbi:DUF4153 domain-containing protein [Rhizohabitans arisaemae]|uniref:DUF4153 domain-containing protein n=1 Tax=Rhizohabitans arisaemae TaxID=2720610 RepID=UPI0024B0BF81|nr:DUF4153 domain-containing protein [Rhizohabitans arisaemae]
MRWPATNPLDFLGRIKAKLGLVILLAVFTAFVVNELGLILNYLPHVRFIVAGGLALLMVHLLARGMIKPLREMAAGAQTIARGQYGLRVPATSRDEVGELARAFNAMAADLGEVDRQRRELIANVSHELRTPITALRAVLENIVDGVSEPDPVTLSTALAQTERLGRLVAQLLDLSRLESGATKIECETTVLRALHDQAIREAELTGDEVALRSSVLPPGLSVRADPGLLAQVLANLVDNAVRHSPAGGTVTLAARPRGSGVRLSVTDQGPGIPADDRQRVFERFSRLDAGRAVDAGGSGLGLAITREIVELHGGSIRVDGDHSAGCRILVDLPERTTVNEVSGTTPTELGPPHAKRGDAGLSPEEPAPADPGPVAESVEAEPVGQTPSGSDPVAPPGPAAAAEDSPPADSVRPEAGSPGSAESAAGEPAPPAAGSGAGGEGAAPAVPDAVGSGGASAGSVGARTAAVRAAAARSGPPKPKPLGAEGGRAVLAAIGSVLGLAVGIGAGVLLALFGSIFFGEVTVLLIGFVTMLVGAFIGSYIGLVVTANPPGVFAIPIRPADAPKDEFVPVLHRQSEYTPPSLLPRPDLPATPKWLPVSMASAGLVSAVAAPTDRLGLGMALIAVAVGAAALPGALHRLSAWTVAYGLTAYALVAVVVVRDADWITAPALFAGTALAVLAVTGAASGWLGMLRSWAAMVRAALTLPWFVGPAVRAMKGRKRLAPTALTVVVTVALVFFFGMFFASADAVFADLVDRIFTVPVWVDTVPYRILVAVLIAGLVGTSVLAAVSRPVDDSPAVLRRLPVGRTQWVVPLAALNLLFALFVAVQIAVLFGGNERVLRTANLTYAEYARQGFFQLVAVAAFVLGIVALAVALLPRPKRTDRWLLAGLLGALCGLTLVILVSALQRLGLYTDVYGLTRLRAFVGAVTWWIGALFVLVLLAGAVRLFGGRSGWLPRAATLVTALTVLVFVWWNPDLRIAETNVKARGVAQLDRYYLDGLSADAVPALHTLPEPMRSCVLLNLGRENRLGRPIPWSSWNLSRVRAQELLRSGVDENLPAGVC